MRLIDANKFLGFLIFSKHIDSLKCNEVKEAVEMCKVDVLEQIRAEIEREGAMFPDGEFFVSIDRINEIIDKYKEQTEWVTNILI